MRWRNLQLRSVVVDVRPCRASDVVLARKSNQCKTSLMESRSAHDACGGDRALSSPTQRSIEWLKKQGGVPAIVERWNPYARVRQDVWGVGDILAVIPTEHGARAVMVQTTSAANVLARVAKARDSIGLRLWLLSGNAFEVHGWAKRGPRGKAKHWKLARRLNGIAISNGVTFEEIS